MDKLPIYCQFSFYDNFLKECKKETIGPEKKEQLDLISEMIHTNSKVYIDKSAAEIKALTHQTKFLYKKVSNGNGVELKPKQFPEQLNDNFFQKVNPHSIFLINNKQEHEKYQKKYGMWFIAIEDIGNCSITKKNKKIMLSKLVEKYKEWNDLLLNYKHPCNSMIISDNYILNNNDDIEENLLTILRIILPLELTKNRFHLTIITSSIPNIKEQYNLLISKLKKIRPYNIDLKIVIQTRTKVIEASIHDRYIITNYLCICSGHGFSVFKEKKIEKNTRLTFDFVSNSETLEEMDTLIKHYRKIEETIANVGTEIVVMPESESGKITTRLLK